MTISQRLKDIAMCIDKGASVVDVGTDHALLPIYLAIQNIASKIIASDINEGPLHTASENIKAAIESYPQTDFSKIELIKSDGLLNIELPSVNTVVISGMGGNLIANILDAVKDSLESKKLILAPMTKHDFLRKYLYDNGFIISREYISKENNENRLFPIMVAERGNEQIGNDCFFVFPTEKYNLGKNEILYLNFLKNKYSKIYKNLTDKCSEKYINIKNILLFLEKTEGEI